MKIIESFKEAFGTDETTDTNEALPWEETLEAPNTKELEQTNKISRIGRFSNKQKAISGIIALSLLVITFALYNNFATTQNISTINNTEQNQEVSNSEIKVFVSGCVVNPGVYTASNDARAIDIINMAGGFTQDAKKDAINLAQTVKDGEQIIIPSSSTQEHNQGQTTSTQSQDNGKININTADLTTLQKLSGVGPSTAQKIIDYRNTNGKFKTIDEIKNVSGIGEKTFAKFSNQICV